MIFTIIFVNAKRLYDSSFERSKFELKNELSQSFFALTKIIVNINFRKKNFQKKNFEKIFVKNFFLNFCLRKLIFTIIFVNAKKLYDSSFFSSNSDLSNELS